MSDTSGRVRYEPKRKRQIREEIKKRKPGTGGAGGKTPAKEAAGSVAVLRLSLPKELVWIPFHIDGLLDNAYNKSELIAYLKLTAEFIEIAASSGLIVVTDRFGVERSSSFTMLQRRIREKVDQTGSSEFNGAARRSFQVGTITWAGRLLKQADPTKFKLDRVVEVVGQQVDKALVLAPRLILQDYGERLLRSALPEGKGDRRIVEDAIRGFRQQFETFMREHDNPAVWGSETIAATVFEYVELLWK